MAKYSAVKATVNAYIKQNGRKEITGKVLNAVLNATIDSLGKFYQFAGEALPTDDPGTPDQNLTYLAGTAGTYTNFGGLTLDTQEIALLMWDGEWKKQTLLFGIQEVDASVDNQVGTPSVDVDFVNNVLTLSFHNIKGDKGDTGDPAGFGQVTASVDDTIGNPSVQVQTSGEDTAKNIAFEFHGLRGETGITSVVVNVDNTTGNPACSVSLVGQVLHLDFTGLKGLKGDTGVSADYPITIYNGLDSDATDQALSAAQGKVLDGKVSQLGQEVDGIITDNTFTDEDLVIADEKNEYAIVAFSNGEIRTKNFDSSKVKVESGESIFGDFVITDEDGNVIVAFSDGHIRTKYFNSQEIQIKTQWYGKKVSIIGDSISTAPSANAVEFTVLDSDIANERTLQGYPTYYDIGTTIGEKTVDSSMVGVLTSFTPVSGDAGKTIGKALNYNTSGASGVASYVDTWWHKLASKLGMEVLQNVSWSGASISSHEGNTDIYKTSYAWHPAQINKLATRDSDGNTINPDVVIIYRGTNDMTHSPYTALSEFGASATSIPNTDYEDSMYDFKVAYCLTIKKIREAYPQAKIVLCTLNVFKRINYSQFPTNNGTNTLPEYNNAIREVANMMGCGLIEFDKDGITFENCYPTYISDSSTIPTHPNPTGHSAMAEKAIIDIIKF